MVSPMSNSFQIHYTTSFIILFSCSLHVRIIYVYVIDELAIAVVTMIICKKKLPTNNLTEIILCLVIDIIDKSFFSGKIKIGVTVNMQYMI